MTANICAPMVAPEAPDGVNEITSSSLTSRAAVGSALKSWPAAAPATVTVIAPPVIAVPLIAVAMVASAVVIAPCVTQPTLSTRPRNGARIWAASGEAPIERENAWTVTSLTGWSSVEPWRCLLERERIASSERVASRKEASSEGASSKGTSSEQKLFATRYCYSLLATRFSPLFARLRRGQVEHAAGGLLVPRHQCVFRQHLPALGIAGARERDGDHLAPVEIGDRPHLRLQHERVARAHEAVGHDLEHAEVAIVELHRGDDLLRLGVLGRRGAAGEGRERLLVEAADHDAVGLAARVPDRLQHALELVLLERALAAVGAGAGAVRRRRVHARGALRRVGLDPGQHRGELARGRAFRARGLGLVGADQDRLHVALELEALEHFLVLELVVAAGVLDRTLGAGHADDLVRDLAEVAEPDGGRDRDGDSVVTFELGVSGIDRGERLCLPFVIDGGRLLALARGHERGVGGIDAVDDVGQIFSVADGVVGGERCCFDSHGSAFLCCCSE